LQTASWSAATSTSGVANIHRVKIYCIDSRGTVREFVSVSQVIFTSIVVFIKKIRPHPHIKKPNSIMTKFRNLILLVKPF
jgi:hypothetical protein